MSEEASGEGYKVLFVEDNEVTSVSLSKLFKNRGYDVTTAAPVAEAEEAIRVERQFTHMVCDYNLQGENGLVATASFHEKFPAAPILIFTGHEDFLKKPEVMEFFSQNSFVRNVKVLYTPVEQNQIYAWFNEANRLIKQGR